MNTTDTCATLRDLRSATRYIVYVTASNEFGMSVPSSRALAATNAIISPTNSTLPQIERIPCSFFQVFVVTLTVTLRSTAGTANDSPFFPPDNPSVSLGIQQSFFCKTNAVMCSAGQTRIIPFLFGICLKC